MAKRLKTTVHLADDKGAVHVLGPGQELPGWAEERLSKKWGERDDLWEGEAAKAEPAKAAEPKRTTAK